MGSRVNSTRSVGFRHMWLRTALQLNASKREYHAKEATVNPYSTACSCFTSAEYRGIRASTILPNSENLNCAANAGGVRSRISPVDEPDSPGIIQDHVPRADVLVHENESCKLEGSGVFRRLAEALAYLELVVEPGLHLCSVVERAGAVVREETASAGTSAERSGGG